MQLPFVIMQEGQHAFFRDFYFFASFKNVYFDRKQKKKKIITTRNTFSQIITQGSWTFRFIQFNLIEKCANFFMIIREI